MKIQLKVTQKSPKVEISKWIRQQLKAEFPECKFSVVTRHGRNIDIALMEAPFEVFEAGEDGRYRDTRGNPIVGYAQLNEYALRDEYNKDKRMTNGVTLTRKAWKVMSRVAVIMNEHNFDYSDIQSDYFFVNYYTSVAIGKWDKPFTKSPRRE